MLTRAVLPRLLLALAPLSLLACESAPLPPPAAPANAPRPPFARAGGTTSFVGGSELAHERYEDDGDTLVCHVDALGQKAVESLSRSARTVRIEQDGKTIVRHLAPGVVALEAFCWQQLLVAAEDYRGASTPVPVQVLAPGRDSTAGGTIQVDTAPTGDRYVTLRLGELRVSADISAEGAVEHVRIPAQRTEASGHASKTAIPEKKESTPMATVDESVSDEPLSLERPGSTLHGTLEIPKDAHGPLPVVLLVAGSGPTDRDMNSAIGLKTDSFKQLAAALAHKGVATLRYDKRGVGESTFTGDRSQVVLGDFIEDARALVAKLRADARFSSVAVLGHSEGGLIGLELAQSTPVDALVLVSTAGRPLAAVLHEQLSPKVDAATMKAFEEGLAAIRAGNKLTDAPQALAPLLNDQVAVFLRSAMDIDPQPLVASAKAKRLAVIQGDLDMQVGVDDARKLAAAAPRAQLTLVPGMAHTLKIEKERAALQPSYFDPKLPLASALVDAVVLAVK
jgi:pimeloyl-ACP methyl ester carboxylesterase